MLERFKKFIESEKLIPEGSRILLAVSGGVDSMVMCDLFKKSGFDLEVAHCNFNLRGDESDADEKLVKRFCLDFGIKFHSIRFDTEMVAKNAKKGIQETARKLRYQWFEEVMESNSLELLATAHHKEDSVETMLFNFSRGSGIDGLKGIESKRDQIIRPLLFAIKSEILRYAQKNQIPYREDASNKSLKYSRNKIRHRVIPELKEVNSSLVETLYTKSKIFKEGSDLIQKTILAELKKTLIFEGDSEKFPLSHLKDSSYPRLLLWNWLEKKGFTSAMIEEVSKIIDSQTGKKIENDEYSLFVNRDYLELMPNKTLVLTSKSYNSIEELKNDSLFKVEIKNYDELDISIDPAFAYLDMDKIVFPLLMREWQAGDRFVPFGRKKEEKVKEFLTHQKVSSSHKSNFKVLISEDKIMWLIGLRIDDRFKLGSSTKLVLCLEVCK